MWRLLFCVFLIGQCSGENVIIIGAGAAGIATASRLLNNNITDFRILEAENRIGGRIHSFHLGDAFVDIGAEIVYGVKGEPVYELAKNYLRPYMDMRKALIYYGTTKKTTGTLFDDFNGFVERAAKDACNVSLGDAILAEYNTSVLEIFKKYPDMRVYSQDFLRTFECSILYMEGAFRWFEITSKSGSEIQNEGEVLSWDGLGFKTILELLLKNYPNKTGYNIYNQLSMKKTVTKIILENNSVTIKCQDGSEYLSDHVVFTPSLGVLKHDHKKLFVPELETIRANAIEDLGIDAAVKIVIEFSTPWWGDQNQFIFAWDEEKKKNLINDIRFGPVKNGDHWLSWFYHIGTSANNSKVLIGWIFGPMVPEIEMLTEEEMKIGTLYTIKTFLEADFNISEPIKVIHSKWYTNPNFRGTYSFDTIKSARYNNPTVSEVLSQPIKGPDGIPRILFAGEATSSNGHSTVNRAVETGYREGDRLIEILKIK